MGNDHNTENNSPPGLAPPPSALPPFPLYPSSSHQLFSGPLISRLSPDPEHSHLLCPLPECPPKMTASERKDVQGPLRAGGRVSLRQGLAILQGCFQTSLQDPVLQQCPMESGCLLPPKLPSSRPPGQGLSVDSSVRLEKRGNFDILGLCQPHSHPGPWHLPFPQPGLLLPRSPQAAAQMPPPGRGCLGHMLPSLTVCTALIVN